MKEHIVGAIIGAIVGGLAALFASSSMGLYEKQLTEGQLSKLASKIVDEPEYRDVLLKKIAESKLLESQKIDPKPQNSRTSNKDAPADTGIPTSSETATNEASAIKSLSKPIVLAFAIVQDGRLRANSGGLSYDTDTGVIVFPNSDNRQFIPIISEMGASDYSAEESLEKHLVHHDYYAYTSSFRVSRVATDIPDKRLPPRSFSAVAIAYE